MYGKTSVTFTADELLHVKTALSLDIKTVSELVAGGDSYGVWQEKLTELQSAYKKIERAIRRV